MEEAALTPQVVARLVFEEQIRATKANTKAQAIRRSWAEKWAPYYKSRVETVRKDDKNRKGISTSCHGCQDPKAAGEKEDEDTDNLATDHSFISSPMTPQSFLHSTASSSTSTFTSAESTLPNELCPTFTSTGSCIATCLQTHDPSRTALCHSRIRGQPCLRAPACRMSHTWSFRNAPTCANFLVTRYCILGNQCGFAHNEKVWPVSYICEEFSDLGFCEAGGDCDKIHWLGFKNDTSTVSNSMLGTCTQQDAETKSSIARAKVAEKGKSQNTAKSAEKASRRSFNGEMWAKGPEELLGSEIRGQFALQEDFVAF